MQSPPNPQTYNRLERWLLSPRGKRTLNRFYAWGAAFVILGALFKFLKWPYADVILFFSMMTEVCVFFISGFEPEEANYPMPEEGNKSSTDGVIPSSSSAYWEGISTSQEAYEAEMQNLAHSIKELQAEHQRMTQNLAELNRLYARMLQAMTQSQANGHSE